jgi:hypothetical protein
VGGGGALRCGRLAGRPNPLRWLLLGSRRGFEIVVLDHGTYMTVRHAAGGLCLAGGAVMRQHVVWQACEYASA